VLKDAQAGVSVQDLCRKHGISDATFYKWRAKYAGLGVSDVKKLRQLEEENRRLKQMVAEQALDIQVLKAVTAKNWSGPRRRGRRHRASSHALGSASGGCAGEWPWIGIRRGTAVGDGRRIGRHHFFA
jgi:putative transposase